MTGAGPQSNWTMLAALACLRHGLEPHVVCYGPATAARRATCGCTAGSAWTCGSPETAERSSVDAGIEAVTAELRAAGRRPYPVPRGGATPLGALGYVRASVELAAQLAGLDRAAGRAVAGHGVVRDPGRAGRRGGAHRGAATRWWA